MITKVATILNINLLFLRGVRNIIFINNRFTVQRREKKVFCAYFFSTTVIIVSV